MRTALVMLVACGIACGCSGPVGPIPGGALDGTPTAWPEDWAFTDEVENVLLQTDPTDPYSVTIWCVRHNGELYVAAAEDSNRWAQKIARDNRVVLNVDNNLYAARAVVVTDLNQIASVMQGYAEKYDYERDSSQGGGVLYRLTPQN